MGDEAKPYRHVDRIAELEDDLWHARHDRDGWMETALKAQRRIAELEGETSRLRGALVYFAKLDAMEPPESLRLNEWLPAVTGARAALKGRQEEL